MLGLDDKTKNLQHDELIFTFVLTQQCMTFLFSCRSDLVFLSDLFQYDQLNDLLAGL